MTIGRMTVRAVRADLLGDAAHHLLGVIAFLGRRRGGSGRSAFARRLAVVEQNGDRLIDRHILGSLGDQQAPHGALVDGLDFHGRLVGFDLGDDIPALHRIAFAHEPFHERAHLHGGRQSGHEDLGAHALVIAALSSSMASSQFAPSKGSMSVTRTAPGSRQRTLTLKPFGSERGT